MVRLFVTYVLIKLRSLVKIASILHQQTMNILYIFNWYSSVYLTRLCFNKTRLYCWDLTLNPKMIF